MSESICNGRPLLPNDGWLYFEPAHNSSVLSSFSLTRFADTRADFKAPFQSHDSGRHFVAKTMPIKLGIIGKRVNAHIVFLARVDCSPNYPCKNDRSGQHLLPEILGQTDRVGVKSPIFYLFLLVAPQLYNTYSEKSS